MPFCFAIHSVPPHHPAGIVVNASDTPPLSTWRLDGSGCRTELSLRVSGSEEIQKNPVSPSYHGESQKQCTIIIRDAGS